jgi:hypothetical protein
MRASNTYTAERRSASAETIRLPLLDMWQRGSGIYGAFAGLKLDAVMGLSRSVPGGRLSLRVMM